MLRIFIELIILFKSSKIIIRTMYYYKTIKREKLYYRLKYAKMTSKVKITEKTKSYRKISQHILEILSLINTITDLFGKF